jgi:hypothetical protein
MVSDMVLRGAFHRHIMTSGGRTARLVRSAQPDSDRTLPAMPARQPAETQTAATVPLMESSFMLKVYGPAFHRAVPQCTRSHNTNPTGPRPHLGRAGLALRCAIENSAERVCSLQFVKWRCGRHVENYMLLMVGAVVVLITVVIIPRICVPGGVNASAFGWMSARWLAEHRASHSG